MGSSPSAGLLFVGFEGPSVTPELRALVAAGACGVVLFSRNVKEPRQVAELISEIKGLAARPLVVAVDQEGGSVQRLKSGFSPVPSMRSVGSRADLELAHRVGRLLGRELRAVGVDLDLAPVLDVDTRPENPVIGQRSFGRSPEWVGALGVALARGLEWEGVASCAKHFPGHGDTLEDSHFELPRLPHDLERLRAVELLPFRRYASAGLASVMTAHVLFEALDPEKPATLSERVIEGLLRRELGFEGLVLSDDLEMKAIAAHFGGAEAAVSAVRAGVDVLLCCAASTELAWRSIEALDRARRVGSAFEARVLRAQERSRDFAARWARPAEAAQLDRVGRAEDRAFLDATFGGG